MRKQDRTVRKLSGLPAVAWIARCTPAQGWGGGVTCACTCPGTTATYTLSIILCSTAADVACVVLVRALSCTQLATNDTASAMQLFEDVAYGNPEQGSIYERSEANLMKVTGDEESGICH